MSNAEINNELKVLGRMFSLAVESGKLVVQPKVPMLKENNARTGFFEPRAVRVGTRHLPDAPAAARHVHVCHGLAARAKSTSLQWRQVDFAGREVRLESGHDEER